MSANWDVDELEARKDEVIEKNLLKMDLKGEFGSAVATTPAFTTVLYPNEEGARFDMDHFLGTQHAARDKALGAVWPYGLLRHAVRRHRRAEAAIQRAVDREVEHPRGYG